ncbi:universal stress protein [Natrialbaceae archaeon A-gly3]
MADSQRSVLEANSTGTYTLVVAVADRGNVEQLMRTAVNLAAEKDGEIEVVSVIHKTPTSPFRLFSDQRIKSEFATGHQEVLDRATAAAAEASVPVEGRLLIGTDVAGAILTAVEEADADALFLGWHDKPRAADVVLGTTVDPVIRRAPCDVFVERVGTTANGLESVLLPTVGGPHVEPATDLVGAVAAAEDATVTVVSYVPTGADERERASAREYVEAASGQLTDVPVETVVEESDDVAGSVVVEAGEHDLVVLGATRERTLRRRVVGSVAATVSRRADPPVVIAKRRSEGSWLSSIFDLW